jgi:parallel beta-helix repeat protein
MKSNIKLKIILIITFGTLLTSLPITTLSYNRILNFSYDLNLENKYLQSSATWALSSIHIDANWSLTEQTYNWCTGGGTVGNPYIIENVEIDAGGIGSGILVENSHDHFIIRNCEITNSAPLGSTWHSKIKLQNVTNGILEGNNCSGAGVFGIYLVSNCSNNIIRDNLVNKNSDGLFGIGIMLRFSCSINKIIRNYLDSNGGSSECFGIVIHDYSFDNFIQDNTITKQNTSFFSYGIYILRSFNNSIVNNVLSKNLIGIGTGSLPSVSNTISENQILNNNYGILLDTFSGNSTIKKNLIKENTIGIEMDITTGNNSLYNNCFIENDLHSIDSGLNNMWDNGIEGNFWDNYTGLDIDDNGIGDIPYNITGSAGSQDFFPLTNCPISTPQDGGGIPIELIILISVIGGAILLGVATILLVIRKRKRFQ